MACRFKINKRCRAHKYYMRQCGGVRPLFCDHKAATARHDVESRRRITEEIEEMKCIGMGSR